MTRVFQTSIFLFVLFALSLGAVSAKEVPPPTPEGPACVRTVSRHTDFVPAFDSNTDRAILSDVVFSVPPTESSCVATYQIINEAMTDVFVTNDQLFCDVSDQLRYMYGYCSAVITQEARAQFIVSKVFHGAAMSSEASDTDTNWTFVVDGLVRSTDIQPAAEPMDTVNTCQFNVRRYSQFDQLQGTPANTSRVGEIVVLGNIGPCTYAFFFSYSAGIDFTYGIGNDVCTAIDANTAYCEGFTDTQVNVGFADTLNGSYPADVRVYGNNVAEVKWQFRGHPVFIPRVSFR